MKGIVAGAENRQKVCWITKGPTQNKKTHTHRERIHVPTGGALGTLANPKTLTQEFLRPALGLLAAATGAGSRSDGISFWAQSLGFRIGV